MKRAGRYSLVILDDGSGTRIELHLAGYQYPQFAFPDYDANWLNVSIRVTTPDRTWRATDPCLLTDEVGWLAMWLRKLGEGGRQPDGESFVEPCLNSHRVQGPQEEVVLRVTLSHEFGPPPRTRPTSSSDLIFPCSPEVLLAASESLLQELTEYPPRDGWGDRPPFVPPDLTPTFFVRWVFFPPVKSQRRAREVVEEYTRWADLAVEIDGLEPTEEARRPWAVWGRTDTFVPNDDYGEALFRTLSRLPLFYGIPQIENPFLRPDGYFWCEIALDPSPGEYRNALARLGWRCVLANVEDRWRMRLLREHTGLPPSPT